MGAPAHPHVREADAVMHASCIQVVVTTAQPAVCCGCLQVEHDLLPAYHHHKLKYFFTYATLQAIYASATLSPAEFTAASIIAGKGDSVEASLHTQQPSDSAKCNSSGSIFLDGTVSSHLQKVALLFRAPSICN